MVIVLEVFVVFFAALLGTLFASWIYDWIARSEQEHLGEPPRLHIEKAARREIYGRKDKRAPKVNDDVQAWKREHEIL